MRQLILTVALAACVSPAVAQAQVSFTQASKKQWDDVKVYVIKSAEQVPEADYAFKPTEKVRSFGELITHVADDNFGICALSISDKTKNFGDIEKQKKTAKADLVAALKASVAYCDAAYAKMDDKTAAEVIDMFKTPTPRLGVLMMNTNHVWEHYGNIITYLRLKNMVPPSSQGASQ
jgi:uncharacterized damage-inducible protein DinB